VLESPLHIFLGVYSILPLSLANIEKLKFHQE
jgi:hypothetical protein